MAPISPAGPAYGSATTTPWDRITRPWESRGWRRAFHLVTGLPIALLAVTATAGPVVLAVAFAGTVLAPLLVLLVPLVPLLAVPALTWCQRARFAALLGVEIPAAPGPPGHHPVTWLYRRARAASTWRQLGYHLLSPLISGLGCLAVAAAWSGGLVLALVAVRAWGALGALPATAPAVAAVALFATGLWLAAKGARLDLAAAEALLAPGPCPSCRPTPDDGRTARERAAHALAI